MSTREALDGLVARALFERGLVSDKALAHARAVQRRGYANDPLDQLLVELEHLSSEARVQTLAELTAAPVWDGRGADPQLIAAVSAHPYAALAVRREGATLFYATPAPHDEGVREDLRAVSGALRAEPLVASEATIERARREAGLDGHALELPPGWERPRSEWEALERTLRQRWQRQDASINEQPLVVATNKLLLDYPARVIGAALRIEASEQPVVRGAVHGRFEDPGVLVRARSTQALQIVIWRLKQMAGLPEGRGTFDDWMWMQLGRGQARSFYLHVEVTDRGDVALLRRTVPWFGAGPPMSPEWSAHRAALDECTSSFEENRVERLERARRASLQTAERIGASALLEVVTSLLWLAGFLDQHERASEAEPLLQRARELVDEHELGSRALGDVEWFHAYVEPDLAKSSEHCERASGLYGARGPGMQPIAAIELLRARVERLREAHEQALSAAESARADDRAWFGGTTATGAAALAEASLACAALGRPSDAERYAREALAAAEKIECLDESVHWALGRAALANGRSEQALGELSRALSFHSADNDRNFDWAAIDLDLARAHEALGQLAEARAAALRGCARDHDAETAGSLRELRALLRRQAPYR